jgi:ribosome-binding ATPase YchF (GTP1/OBG family)
MIVAMNKADIAPPGNIDLVKKISSSAVVTMSEAERALKKANASGLVRYVSGNGTFDIVSPEKLNEGQKKALDRISQLMKQHGSTGVQRCLEMAAFETLRLIAVYPVEDENKFTDHFGRVLPDAILMPTGSTAKKLAYRVHTDLGEKFIRAVNAKTKRIIGSDYVLQDGDVIKIISGK